MMKHMIRTSLAAAAVAAVLFILLSCSGCSTESSSPSGASLYQIIPGPSFPQEIETIAVMLQGNIFDELDDLRTDVLVIDHAEHGDAGSVYTSAEITGLKQSTSAKVLSYLSVGEAEDYRWYFEEAWIDASGDGLSEEAPDWISCENENWEGNYPVRYWEEAWQQILLSYVDMIQEAGFDGVFLDVIDVFEFWSDPDTCAEGLLSEEEAALRMIHLITRIAEHAREQDPEFLMIAQNAEAIVNYDEHGEYLAVIDALNLESLFYLDGEPLDPQMFGWRMEYIQDYLDAGKTVFSIDYVYEEGDASGAWIPYMVQAREYGIIGYPAHADRQLEGITPYLIYQEE